MAVTRRESMPGDTLNATHTLMADWVISRQPHPTVTDAAAAAAAGAVQA